MPGDYLSGGAGYFDDPDLYGTPYIPPAVAPPSYIYSGSSTPNRISTRIPYLPKYGDGSFWNVYYYYFF